MNRLTQEQQDELFTTSVAAEYALRFRLARAPFIKYTPAVKPALHGEFDANITLENAAVESFKRG